MTDDFDEFKDSVIRISLAFEGMRAYPNEPRLKYFDEDDELMTTYNLKSDTYEFMSEDYAPYDKAFFDKLILENKENYVEMWEKRMKEL
jgi:hypothetical protein